MDDKSFQLLVDLYNESKVVSTDFKTFFQVSATVIFRTRAYVSAKIVLQPHYKH